jgi:hypothetical protein
MRVVLMLLLGDNGELTLVDFTFSLAIPNFDITEAFKHARDCDAFLSFFG